MLYTKWFKQLKPFVVNAFKQPNTTFSIIIPARNEANNIQQCVQSILQNNYPKHLFEVIVVDDFSEDETYQIVQQIATQHNNVKAIQLSNYINNPINSYKKKAIEIGIQQSNNSWILTTDADCIVPPNWLMNYDNFIQQNNVVFIAAPVSFYKENSVLSMFQFIDFMSLQGITAAVASKGFHAMCNGANLGFSKAIFYEVDGYNNINQIASGDDFFLMNKIKNKYSKNIGYLFSKDAIVTTPAMPTWKNFLNQRIRWASKANKLEANTVAVLSVVFMLNVLLLFSIILSFFNTKIFLFTIVFICIKAIIESIFMKTIMQFFGKYYLLWQLALQPIHLIYTTFAGFLGMFGKYNWKDRKVK